MKKLSIFIFCVVISCSKVYSQDIRIVNAPEKLKINFDSNAEEVQPLYTGDGTLYFVRTFHEQNIGGKMGGQDIWYTTKSDSSQWSAPVNLIELNNAYNNAVVGISADRETLYVINSYSAPTRWRYGISESTKTTEGWSRPKEVPIPFDSESDLRSYYVSPNGDVILASLENKESLGSEDLFIYLKEGEKWSGPIHLPEEINSEDAEISPFITSDHKFIFFASDKPNGLGNFDIYSSQRLDDDSWENWSEAKNLGSDINTSGFEGYFATFENGMSFFASNQDAQSSDLFQTKIQIRFADAALSVIKGLQEKFSSVLVEDILLRDRVADISGLSSKSTDAVSTVLIGSKALNNELLSMNQRDSLLGIYVADQLSDSLPNDEIRRRELWTKALVEDITMFSYAARSISDNLSDTEIETDANDTEDSEQVSSYKTEISQVMVKNAVLKKEISDLITENAFEKGRYTQQIKVGESGTDILDGIRSNNDLLESKIAEWEANLQSINALNEDLINATSSSTVYLSERTEKKLLDSLALAELESALLFSTGVSDHIKGLAERDAELISPVNQLLASSSEISKGLLEMEQNYAKLDEMVLSVNGLDRQSQQFQEVKAEIDALANKVLETHEGHDSLLASQADGSTDSLVVNLSAKMLREVEIKKNISDLFYQNSALKKKLVEDLDGGDATTKKIIENEEAIKEQLEALQESLEEANEDVKSIEKINFIDLYALHSMESSDEALSEFNGLLENDRSIQNEFLEEDLIKNMTSESFQSLVEENRAISGKQMSENTAYLDISGHVLNTVRDQFSSTIDFETLSAENSSEINEVAGAYQNTSERMEAYLNKEASLSEKHAQLLIENIRLKQEIRELIIESQVKKQAILESGLSVTEQADELNVVTESLREKMKKLELNIVALEEEQKTLREEALLQKRAQSVLLSYGDINERISEALSMDRVILEQRESLVSGDEDELFKEVGSANREVINALDSINMQYIAFNENVEERARLATEGSDDESIDSKNLESSTRIDELGNKIFATVEESIESVMSSSDSSYFSKSAQFKQEIASMISQNVAFKMFLDSTGVSSGDELFIDLIALNNQTLEDKVSEWVDYLKKQEGQKIEQFKNSEATPKVEGYAVQVLAMPAGVAPINNYLRYLDEKDIVMTRGRDGLDRYYIGNYKSKKKALEVMRSIRARGYEDAFVRPIIKYSIL